MENKLFIIRFKNLKFGSWNIFLLNIEGKIEKSDCDVFLISNNKKQYKHSDRYNLDFVNKD